MRIDRINIQNFRCFKSYNVLLAEKTTVFIGKNGTGKTNLIDALKQGLSFIFSKTISATDTLNTDEEGKKRVQMPLPKLKPLSNSADLHVAKFDVMDAFYDSSKRDFDYPINISYTGWFDNCEIEWAFIKNSQSGSLLSVPFQAALHSFLAYYNTDTVNKPLPVLAFFSDSYPHNKVNFGKYAKNILNIQGPLPRNFGYYQWDAETDCAEIWQNKYINSYNKVNDFKNPLLEKKNRLVDIYLKQEIDPQYDLIKGNIEIQKLKGEILDLENKSYELAEINFIDEKIVKFTKVIREGLDFINNEFEISKIIVDRPKGLDDHKIQFVFSKERVIYFDILPQGYKRLLSIVFDIAYRSYILNGSNEPTGIVIIDEVELHLHPTLAQEVLERLRKTFPEIQFIVSTHSPLVISNLKEADEYGQNKIIKLLNENGDYINEDIENIYGIDYITSLMDVMEAKYRPSTIDKLIDTYVALKARKKEIEALLVYEKLKTIFNGEPNQYIKNEIDRKLKSYQQ